MSLLADYYVLADTSITPALTTDGAFHDFALPLPANFFQTGGHLPVLSFRLDTGTPSNLMFRVYTAQFGPPPPPANLTIAFTATFNSDVFQSMHEVLNANSFVAGATNTIRFERVSGTGTLAISVVVLWYKRNVTSTNLAITP